MKRCPKDKEEKKKSSKWMMKQCSTKSKSWADLDLDLLGEIKKKLYWGDHARFSGVCKTWLAAQHEKRAGDVLPWLLFLCRDFDVNTVSYDLYQPHNVDPDQPLVSGGVKLNEFFYLSRIRKLLSIMYVDGYLFVSLSAIDHTCTHFLLISIPTNRATTLPQFNHPLVPHESDYQALKAVSTCPASPDCVFLALHLSDNQHHWSIGIFRHGDTQWTNTDFHFEESLDPCEVDVVFIQGLFYFLCYDRRLASYDIASKEFKLHSFLTPIYYGGIDKFFKLDGELMLMYYDIKVRKHFLTSYDWSQKLWVPLKDLGDRSLFLSMSSVYVDTINYYGVSPNKIYILKDDTCYVYSFENGQLLKSYSSGLRNWDGLDYTSQCSLWVEPPDLLPK